ncbi:MAG: permease-like cell division protein FtsX, partial [bacterium]|nr:permease-like cell division protein FtsX [bacterium]
MMTSFQRVLRLGIEKFMRDKSSSSAALFVMVVVLTVVTTLFLAQGTAAFLVSTLEESVDVSAYLKDGAAEETVSQLRSELESLPEVREVAYVSKEEALREFVELHKQDEVILESLEIVGQNPLLASLSIKAFSAAQYPAIAEFLENTASASIISDVDYFDRAPVINRLSTLTRGIQSAALLATLFAGFIAVLVAFKTIRLTIYNSRDEIEIMRLVGAGNWFIRGPFLIQGIIGGVLATLITTFLFFPLALFISLELQSFAPGFNLFSYFAGNLLSIVLLQLLVGIGIGAFSSLIAIRRYL